MSYNKLIVKRMFTTKGTRILDTVPWEYRDAVIKNDKGEVVFEKKNVYCPSNWSVLATNIVASKYLYENENSVAQLIHRVSQAITGFPVRNPVFRTAEDADAFGDELCYMLLHQMGSFNSPVWFNVGLWEAYGVKATGKSSFRYDPMDEDSGVATAVENSYQYPQGSACFILSVEDNMYSIMDLAKTEAMLFKYGSGCGTNLSSLRSSQEKLTGGGQPSGPLSFMRVFDQVAGVVKSGGKTRRAAKMQILNVEHPDIMEFIQCKTKEEKKAWALIDQGYDGSFGGEAYSSVMFQNANLSVRLSDAFMAGVTNPGPGLVPGWESKAVTTGKTIDKVSHSSIMDAIAEGAYVCGDPGVQFDDTINKWHTCKASGRINSSNPCSEFMFLDDTACNLASLNLMKFIDDSGALDHEKFKHAVGIFITAQDILVGMCSYPTEQLATNSYKFRPLGLGYANLGALLMRSGIPYDSDAGRDLAAYITSLMTAYAYQASASLAVVLGPFEEFQKNRESMLDVIRQHKAAAGNITGGSCDAWSEALRMGEQYGFRNSQVTVLAPTGTIGFMMDCDTTGIEPELALVKFKQLVGGGSLKLVNQTIPDALFRLGYDPQECSLILEHLGRRGTVEGSPLKPEHLPVFDCAFKPENGVRSIPYMAHLFMMSAVQPFLSGAISKTVNMPKDCTVAQIRDTYIQAWHMGIKAVAIYRDGSKRTQPMNVSSQKKEVMVIKEKPKSNRERLPATRKSLTHKFEIGGHEGYVTVGLYADGRPGEMFIAMAKEGSTVGGLMNAFATSVSMGLQYGVPLTTLISKFTHCRFEPSGYTPNPDIPFAKSLVDYIFTWMEQEFAGGKKRTVTPVDIADVEVKADEGRAYSSQEDAPPCNVCGNITSRNASCYRCDHCGNSMGCS